MQNPNPAPRRISRTRRVVAALAIGVVTASGAAVAQAAPADDASTTVAAASKRGTSWT